MGWWFRKVGDSMKWMNSIEDNTYKLDLENAKNSLNELDNSVRVHLRYDYIVRIEESQEFSPEEAIRSLDEEFSRRGENLYLEGEHRFFHNRNEILHQIDLSLSDRAGNYAIKAEIQYLVDRVSSI